MRAELSPTTVGVFGSGTEPHTEVAREVGRTLGEFGVNLLTGGGGGVMTTVSEAFTHARTRGGICIGIIPCASEDDRQTPKRGYPNPFVELAIYTHLPFSGEQGTDDLSRNHINVLSCAAAIALPGGEGTVAEVSLALRYGKPVIAYSHDPSLLRQFPLSLTRAADIQDIKRFLRTHLQRLAS